MDAAVARKGSAGIKSGKRRPGTAKPRSKPVSQKAGDMPAALASWEAGRTASDRLEDVQEVGKSLARVRGAELAAQMLAGTDLTLRDIQEQFGFQPASLSNMANGKTETGPTLWKLFALAEALGFELVFDAKKR